MALQHLRSSTADKRPTPAAMADGQLAVNTAGASPGLFFKDASGNLIKVGPVHVGTTAPNASPASGGATGNTVGEQWLDTSSSKYIFKIWDGTAWRSEAGEFVDAAGDVMTGALGIIAGTAGSPGLYVSGDTNTGIYSPGADQLAITTGGTARLTVDSTGKVLAGTSTALTNAYAIGSALSPALQVEGNTANGAAVSITRHTSAAANLLLQRGVTGTPVADTEAVGQIGFNGFDGTSYYNAALIRGVVDGTPGTGSMPGRLSFQTTPSGSTTPVERLRLDPAGQILAASLGTASLPVWSFTGDPNTGVYSPGADSVAIATNGTQRATVDSSGRLLVGTSTARSNFYNSTNTSKHQVEGTDNDTAAVSIVQTVNAAGLGGQLILAKSNGTGIGANGVVPDGQTLGRLSFQGNDGTEFVEGASIFAQADGATSANDLPTRLVFATTPDASATPVERMRIDNNGSIQHTVSSATGSHLLNSRSAGANVSLLGINTVTAAGTGFNFMLCWSSDFSSERFKIIGNGNVQNANNSYAGISDIKLKENITNANSQWSDIKAIEVKNFNFIDDATRQIGVIAQQVETVSPGLVDETPDRDKNGNDLGTVTKSVKYSVLYMKAVKALQEAMERIETLEASNADLLARVSALESA